MSTRDKQLAEMKAGGHFNVFKLKPGTKALVETEHGIYTIAVLDEKHKVVRMYSTHEAFREQQPKRAFFLGSTYPPNLTFPDLVVKGAQMMFEFADTKFLSSPVLTARIEGQGWHYEAIE